MSVSIVSKLQIIWDWDCRSGAVFAFRNDRKREGMLKENNYTNKMTKDRLRRVVVVGICSKWWPSCWCALCLTWSNPTIFGSIHWYTCFVLLSCSYFKTVLQIKTAQLTLISSAECHMLQDEILNLKTLLLFLHPLLQLTSQTQFEPSQFMS